MSGWHTNTCIGLMAKDQTWGGDDDDDDITRSCVAFSFRPKCHTLINEDEKVKKSVQRNETDIFLGKQEIAAYDMANQGDHKSVWTGHK